MFFTNEFLGKFRGTINMVHKKLKNLEFYEEVKDYLRIWIITNKDEMKFFLVLQRNYHERSFERYFEDGEAVDRKSSVWQVVYFSAR